MRLPVRSYTEAATKLGIAYCRGITPSGILDSDIDHRRGTIVGPTLHWTDRPVRRAGLFRFCLLAARMRSDWSGLPHWQRLYFETTAAYRLGLQVGVRFRLHEMADQKLRARSRLATTHIRPEDRALARKVADWARRTA